MIIGILYIIVGSILFLWMNVYYNKNYLNNKLISDRYYPDNYLDFYCNNVICFLVIVNAVLTYFPI